MSAPPVSGRIDVRREWPHAFVSHRGATMRSGQKKTTSRRLVVRNVFGEPAGYEKLSDREARFAAICLGYSDFHLSRLLSGGERL